MFMKRLWNAIILLGLFYSSNSPKNLIYKKTSILSCIAITFNLTEIRNITRFVLLKRHLPLVKLPFWKIQIETICWQMKSSSICHQTLRYHSKTKGLHADRMIDGQSDVLTDRSISMCPTFIESGKQFLF